MKKCILITALGIFSYSQSNAQVLTGGPELGLNLSTMSQQINGVDINTDMLPGVFVGGVLDIGVTNHFAIQPALYFSMKGFSNDYSNTVILNNVTYIDNYQQHVRVNFIDIPVNFLYKSGSYSTGRFFIGGGPYIGIAAGGKIETERERRLQSNNNGDAITTTESTERSIDIGTSRANDDIKPLDAGLNITGGYEFSNGIFLRGNIGIGLANLQPGGDDDNSLRNRNLGISIGYMFGK